MDNLIICKHCGSDACYVEEVNQELSTYFCYGCGFQTNSLMKDDSEFYKESQTVSKGDTILISTSETIEDLGHVCYYDNDNIGLLGGEQILLQPNRDVLYEKYLFQYARQFSLELKKYAKGLKVFRFNTSDLKQLFIAIPSIEEQVKIADFIEGEIIKIDALNHIGRDEADEFDITKAKVSPSLKTAAGAAGGLAALSLVKKLSTNSSSEDDSIEDSDGTKQYRIKKRKRTLHIIL
jgi:restriction endonuclease S subunit